MHYAYNTKTDWDKVRELVRAMKPRVIKALKDTPKDIVFEVEGPDGVMATGLIKAHMPYTEKHDKKRRVQLVDQYPARLQLTDADREYIGEVLGKALGGLDDVNIIRVKLGRVIMPPGYVVWRYCPKEFPRK